MPSSSVDRAEDWAGLPDHPIIAYIGNIYEYQTAGGATTVRQYYYADATRVAMRVDGLLYWLFGDHICRKPRQTFGAAPA